MIDYGWSKDPVADQARGLDLARRALKSCGDDARALAHIASALVGLDANPETAAAVINRAVTVNPGCAYAWMVAGIVKGRSGAAQAAAEAFLTAKRLEPRSPMRAVLDRSLALALFGQKRFSEALVSIGELLASGDLSDTRFWPPPMAISISWTKRAARWRSIGASRRNRSNRWSRSPGCPRTSATCSWRGSNWPRAPHGSTPPRLANRLRDRPRFTREPHNPSAQPLWAAAA